MAAIALPLLVGAGMMAGGGMAVKKGLNVSGVRPQGVAYGGSAPQGSIGPEPIDVYRQQYGQGVATGAGQADAGAAGLAGLGAWGEAQAMNREPDIGRALDQAAYARERERLQVNRLGSVADKYQPGAQSAAAAALALKQSGQQNLAMARSGTNAAMGLRTALNSNAQAGVDIAQNTALIRAQEEQAAVQLRMEAAARAAAAANAMRGGDMGLAGFHTGRQQFGVSTAGSAYGGLASIGAGREATYLDAQQNLEQAQLQAEMDYERRKSNALISLGAGLIGGGGRVMSMGGGGGGGGK
jgi:hypothetical protein